MTRKHKTLRDLHDLRRTPNKNTEVSHDKGSYYLVTYSGGRD
jgi:hypothetical protein